MHIAIRDTKNWIHSFVIELNICPFAKRAFDKEHLAYTVVDSKEVQECWSKLITSYEELSKITGFIIFTEAFLEFEDFLDFYYACEAWLEDSPYHETYQIVGFHPKYIFEGESLEDHSHYTNRSPYPMIHILRRDDVEKAIANYPDTDQIPINNVALLRSMSLDMIKKHSQLS